MQTVKPVGIGSNLSEDKLGLGDQRPLSRIHNSTTKPKNNKRTKVELSAFESNSM